MFMTRPIPIGRASSQTKVAEEALTVTTEEMDAVAAAQHARALKELEEKEAHALATARARIAGLGMIGSLLDIRA